MAHISAIAVPRSKHLIENYSSTITDNSTIPSSKHMRTFSVGVNERSREEIESCSRFFLEEFEDLNDCLSKSKLSYNQEVSYNYGQTNRSVGGRGSRDSDCISKSVEIIVE